MRDWGDIVQAVCEAMGVERFGIWGHSSGGTWLEYTPGHAQIYTWPRGRAGHHGHANGQWLGVSPYHLIPTTTRARCARCMSAGLLPGAHAFAVAAHPDLRARSNRKTKAVTSPFTRHPWQGYGYGSRSRLCACNRAWGAADDVAGSVGPRAVTPRRAPHLGLGLGILRGLLSTQKSACLLRDLYYYPNPNPNPDPTLTPVWLGISGALPMSTGLPHQRGRVPYTRRED